jgi:hypothetical protein
MNPLILERERFKSDNNFDKFDIQKWNRYERVHVFYPQTG